MVVRSVKEKVRGKRDVLRMLPSSSLMMTSNSPSETPSVGEITFDPYLDDIESLTAIEQNALGEFAHRVPVLPEDMLSHTE